VRAGATIALSSLATGEGVCDIALIGTTSVLHGRVSPSGRLLAVSYLDESGAALRAEAFSLSDGARVKELAPITSFVEPSQRAENVVSDLAFAPDERSLVVVLDFYRVVRWSFATGRRESDATFSQYAIRLLGITPSQHMLFQDLDDARRIHRCSLDAGGEDRSYPRVHALSLLSPAGDALVVLDEAQRVGLLDVESGATRRLAWHGAGAPDFAAFSPSGRRVVVGARHASPAALEVFELSQ
jgi:hypothetical protein